MPCNYAAPSQQCRTMLNQFILCYIISSNVLLYYFMLLYAISVHGISHVISFHAILCHSLPFFAILCHSLPFFAILCHFYSHKMSYYSVPSCANHFTQIKHDIPCHAMPMSYHAFPCHKMPCNAIPCHTMSNRALQCHKMP